MPMYYVDEVATPIGRLRIVATDDALVRIYFPGEAQAGMLKRDAKHPLIALVKIQLGEYFAGTRRIFDIPLTLEGTAFQKKAWGVIKKIPYGKTLSYGDEAKKLGAANAVRAAASANGKNPIPLIIPCHRVISKNGSLGGYSGGLKRKTLLLKLEQHHLGSVKK